VTLPLFEHLSSIAGRLLASPHWLLGLDEALRDDITIKVGGNPALTRAHYYVECPSSVARFLRWLDLVSPK
jgi:hypothetical protein